MLLIKNANIYTLDAENSMADSLMIENGKIIAVGKEASILHQYSPKEIIDLQGKYVYPGFYDAHCHLLRYAQMLDEADLYGATSWEEVLERMQAFHQKHPQKKALIGRGWDQNLWEKQAFPSNERLNELFPNIPVLLTRIDIHAAIVNDKALELVGFKPDTIIKGGQIVHQNGKLTGLLIDNAIFPIAEALPKPSLVEMEALLIQAQKNCLAVGLTTVNEAYIVKSEIDLIERMQASGVFQLRMYCMVAGTTDSKAFYFKNGIYKTDRLHVRAIKYFTDGALGSRGAWLLTPYTDDPTTSGISIHSDEAMMQFAKECYKAGFQMAVHAIGDAANEQTLQAFTSCLPPNNDLRWRIEHAQILQDHHFEQFHQFNITPSIQATHATSDMNWVAHRIGETRVKNAYCFKDLLKQRGFVAAGSDFPIESINPLLGFYAAVARKDVHGQPAAGFQTENALTRLEALKAMTIWAAYSNFEEKERGSLEIGKMADLVVLNEDLMTIPLAQIPQIKVEKTFVDGELCFAKEKTTHHNL